MQYGWHRNIFKISTITNNNKTRKASPQSADQSAIKSFVYVELDKDLNFFPASSLFPFCANITREWYVAKQNAGGKHQTKCDKTRLWGEHWGLQTAQMFKDNFPCLASQSLCLPVLAVCCGPLSAFLTPWAPPGCPVQLHVETCWHWHKCSTRDISFQWNIPFLALKAL